MKKSFLLSGYLCLFFSSSFLFAQKKIEGHWGSKYLDVAYSAAASTDGGYIITGLTLSAGDTNGDIVVIKTSDAGDTTWTFTCGGPKIEGGNSVIPTADGGYMVSGHTEDFGAQDCDAFMMKLDKQGNKEWLKVYGGYADDISEGVIQLPDGGYAFAGITASWGNPAGDSESRHVYFVRTNNTGDTLWTKYYGGNVAEYAYSIAGMKNGGFLAVGWSLSFGNGEYDSWLFRLIDNGDTLWTRLYQKEGSTKYFKIIPVRDNGYVIAGYTTQTRTCKPQGLIVRLDGDGNQQWEKTFGDTTSGLTFHDVAQLPNGNLMLTGTSYYGDTMGSAYILTTDAHGEKITESYCGSSGSYANAIAVQGNNSYLIAGSSPQYGDSYGDLYYMEMDNTISHVPTVTAQLPRMFPNPVKDVSSVILPASEAYSTVSIDITNLNGQVVYNQKNIPANDIVIEGDLFPNGHYFYRITCKDGKVFRGRFITE